MINSQQDANLSCKQQIKYKLRQASAICYKNLRLQLSEKKKLIGFAILPIIISIIYAVYQKYKYTNEILSVIMLLLLKIELGFIGTASNRQIVTLFITERTQNFRQYQMIFGLTHRCHTLSNLFFVGMFVSFFLLPFYLTLNYFSFSFEWVYIFNFAAFVISYSSMTMALTSFFKDHKAAIQLIGILFALSAFLPFSYHGGNGNKQGYSYNFIDYLAMMMPNSAFTIAILEKNVYASVFSLFMTKFYLLLYSLLQFPEYYINFFKGCCNKLKNYAPVFQKNQNHLMDGFQLNEVIGTEFQTGIIPADYILKTQNLVKTYKVNKSNINALNGVNLVIRKREILALLGRNGAGKTTLVDIITNVTEATSGSYSLSNKAISFGICYQHQILYQNLTVLQHLTFYSLLKNISLNEAQSRQIHIDDIIATLNIEGEKDKKVKDLSGGNKRKLSIAIAILGKPEILIFDEPTSGLDPLSRIYVWDVFSKLKDKYSSTIILTTHHLDEAEKLANRICVIEKGNIIVESTAEQIKDKYGKGYYLRINHQFDARQEKNQIFHKIEEQKEIIAQSKLKFQEIELINNEIKFFIKPISRQQNNQEFQQRVITIIEKLEHKYADSIQISLQANSLEESFIAIINDPQNLKDNSGDSIQLKSAMRSNFHIDQERGVISIVSHFLRQTFGMFLKNVYYHKSQILQSFLIYNINILMWVITVFFTKYLMETLANADQTMAQKKDQVTKPNTDIIVQGYIIMATAFISVPVYQKEKKIRFVLNTRGLSGLAYWAGTFLFDFLMFSINLAFLALVFAPKQIAAFTLSAILPLGVTMLLYTYCWSFLFDKLKSANTWFSLINIIFGIIVLPIILFGKGTFLQHVNVIRYFYPFYDLTAQNILSKPQYNNEFLKQYLNIADPNEKTIYINMVFYGVLLILLEIKAIDRIREAFADQKQENDPNIIKLDRVCKSFKDTNAMIDVSYEVNDQRLALLGHNGAGKSTTFGILSSQIHQTSGDVYLENKLKKKYQKNLHSAGICYQDDALWEEMLVSEIMKIVSWCIPVQNPQKQVQWLFQNLEFDSNNLHKRFSQLSGGNKRKLCLAVALYGEPRIRLLDECSTGLDPSSRQAMVNAIKSTKSGCTVFTTHSLSQAEVLCNKSVIMSKGRVLEFDFINKLKAKYFNCRWIDMYLSDKTKENPDTLLKITKKLQQDKILILQNQNGKLRVQASKIDWKCSQILRYMQSMKNENLISSFANNEPKLVDVYLKVTAEDGDIGHQQL